MNKNTQIRLRLTVNTFKMLFSIKSLSIVLFSSASSSLAIFLSNSSFKLTFWFSFVTSSWSFFYKLIFKLLNFCILWFDLITQLLGFIPKIIFVGEFREKFDEWFPFRDTLAFGACLRFLKPFLDASCVIAMSTSHCRKLSIFVVGATN